MLERAIPDLAEAALRREQLHEAGEAVRIHADAGGKVWRWNGWSVERHGGEVPEPQRRLPRREHVVLQAGGLEPLQRASCEENEVLRSFG